MYKRTIILGAITLILILVVASACSSAGSAGSFTDNPATLPSPTSTTLYAKPLPSPSTQPTITPPTSTPSPVAPEALPSRPPEIKEFMQSGTSVSATYPLEFAAAKDAVNQTFLKLFGESYYQSHQSLVDYYQPHDIYKLEQALASLVNLTDWTYKEDYFDCSEMTALTEYALEAAGFDTLIVTSLDPSGTGDPDVTTGHAWCVVVMKTPSGTQLIPVEATAPGYPQIPQRGKKTAYRAKGKTGYQAYDEYITRGWVLVNIYESFRYLPEEFDWWNSAQINRSWFKRDTLN